MSKGKKIWVGHILLLSWAQKQPNSQDFLNPNKNKGITISDKQKHNMCQTKI
jgi:hypothetical protein